MRLIFMGTPEAAVPTLQRCLNDGHEVVAVWTQPDRPAGRGKKPKTSAVKQFATIHGLAVYDPHTLKSAEALNLFAAHKADAAIVVAYGHILPATFLTAPEHGCMNAHFSLLPKYRGAAPVNWAIINGESKTGVTTMRMDAGLDTGAILLQRSTEIRSRETPPALMQRLALIGADLVSETLENLHSIEPRPQDNLAASFAPMLKKQDGLIDWSRDAFDLERRIRGLRPWPNAYTYYRSRRMVILEAHAAYSSSDLTLDGGVLEAAGDRLIVSCGSGTVLCPDEIQLEGRRPMSVHDFLNGTHIHAGERFGE